LAALTFDDGPHPQYTPHFLELLKRHDAKATFFMIGEAAHRHPDLVRAVAEAGHAIGNHSWNHPSFPLITRSERRLQVRRCAEAIAPYDCKLFRPPYGSENIPSHLDVWRLGYRMVNWNIGVPDWLDHEGPWLADRIAERLRPGSVILMHDGLFNPADSRYADRSATLAAVSQLLESNPQHLRFVTLPEMFRCGHPRRS
jgi:peptidoglycan-N-acetylglucosamine deacetylase